MKYLLLLFSLGYVIQAQELKGDLSGPTPLTPEVDEEGFGPLLNDENLEGWTAARSSGDGDWGVFSYNKEEKAIHAYAGEEQGSKQRTDCLVSEKEFSSFILKLEYKWAGKRFAPREDWDRDAGLLFHVHGDLKKVWPLSVEMQIGETPATDFENGRRRFHTGDLFVLGKNLTASSTVTNKIYDPNGGPFKGKLLYTKLGNENPMGEWNQMEIHVRGADKAEFFLNGQKVLEIEDIEQTDKEGKVSPLAKGRIGLQAEWSEILYRNIMIKEL